MSQNTTEDAGRQEHAACEPTRDTTPIAGSDRADQVRQHGAYKVYCSELSAWTMKRLVNRQDAYVEYIPPSKRRPPRFNKSFTQKKPLTEKVLNNHFQNGPRIALHPTLRDAAGKCWSKWSGIDIDQHDNGKADPEVNRKYALHKYDELVKLGFKPLLVDSNGRGGYQIWITYDKPIPTKNAHAFAGWLVRDWQDHGLIEQPEAFPKSARIDVKGYGAPFRPPGQHHTHNHFSKVWGGSAWLEGEAAVRHILANTGTPATCIPSEALALKPTPGLGSGSKDKVGSKDKAKATGTGKATAKPKATGQATAQTSAKGGQPRTRVDLAREALACIRHYANDYHRWLNVGMALSELGDEGFKLWEEWSKGGAGHQDGACAAKWPSFQPGGGGGGLLSLASLFFWAQQEGWPGQPDAAHNCSALPAYRNFREYESDSEGSNGEPKTKRAHVNHAEMEDYLVEIVTGGWPKRVGNMLFVPGDDHKPIYLKSENQLFSYIGKNAEVDWFKGGPFITRGDFYEYLRLHSHLDRFDTIETQPHWPPMPRTYYLHRPIVSVSTGRLDQFLDFFKPDSAIDRELIRAFILTQFWGGPAGARPAFLITGPDDDSEKGVGVGKTVLVSVIGTELAGGILEVTPNEDMYDIKKRLLSEGGLQLRLVTIDNLKSLKFSWADLEGQITQPVISGHQMYIGEGQRPNTITWAFTLNGASMGKDMASRVIPIKLARPTWQSDWEDRVRAFVREHRAEILSDIRAALESGGQPLKPVTRWGAWECGVLSRSNEAAECQRVIIERQGSVDSDVSEADLVMEYFGDKLRDYGHDPHTDQILIPSQQAAEWLSVATRKHYETNHASAYLKLLNIPQLSKNRKTDVRGWVWKGLAWKDSPIKELGKKPLVDQRAGYEDGGSVLG